MTRIKKSGFPWGSFLKSLAAIAFPVALQNLLTTTASMVDTMMVAPLGEQTVGALGLCAQFSSLMFSGYWGFVGGGSLFIAQYWGAENDEGIERSYGMMLTCMMSVAALFSCATLFAPRLVMQVYTDKETIQQIGVSYLRIVGFAYPMQILSMAMSTLLRGTERVHIPMAASIVSVATNLFLNWVFIYGHLGAPAMGVQGAALATACAAVINVTAIYVMARASGHVYLFRVRGHFRWTKEHLKLFFIKCFPIICNEILIGIGNMVINITLGRQNDEVIAAVAVFRTLEGLIIGFFAGFSNASSILVGKCVGAGELDTAFERAKRLVYLCSGVIFTVGLCILAAHRPILTSMSLSGESFQAGLTLLTIYVFVSVIRMGNWLQNDTYRASGDAVTGTVLEIVFMYLMVIPAVLITGFALHSPYWVIFICCYIDEPIRYIIMQIHLYSGKWIRPVTDQGMAALPAFREKIKLK
ncbi:MAG: MATE family efflux transporter [Oscillospiraceae bacterium]|nr:MATE family efflux transporter [Oscillospiraceae bacterium]